MRIRTLARSLVLAGVLTGLGLGGYAGYQRLTPAPVAAAVSTSEVQVGSVTATVSATGNVAVAAQSDLTFQSSGRLTGLLVSTGDQVAAGQPLATIDGATLQGAVDQARAAYESAVAQLEQTRAGTRPEELLTARAQVTAAQVALAQAQAVPQSADVAAARSKVTSAELALAQTSTARAEDVTAAQAQLDAAQAQLQAVQAPRAEDVATASSQLAQAQSKLDALLDPRAEDVRSAEAAVVSAQAQLQAVLSPRPEDVAAAQASLDQARTQLSQLRDQPQTATPQDLGNAELAVDKSQIAYDQALANVSSASDVRGSTYTSADAEAEVRQALIALQQAQNDLAKLEEQGPTAWEVRQQELAVQSAEASLRKVASPTQADVQQAQASLTQAQATLDKARNPSPYDVQQARESVAQAEANLQKVTSPSPADLASAHQAVVAAQTGLDKLLTPDLHEVQIAQENVTQARAGLEQLLAANRFEVQTAQANLVQAEANLALKQNATTPQDLVVATAAVEQARVSLEQAQTALSQATLSAPYAGTVSATGADLGEQVGSGVAVVTLMDTQRLRADLTVDEADVARVKVGQAATLTLDALPGKPLTGTVAAIAPAGTVTNGVVTYTVRVTLDPQEASEAGVRVGMTTSASIVVESREGVVLAPSRAIRTQGGTRVVQVLAADGETETRQVQTGLAGDQVTEILGGLQPGERLIVSGATATASATGSTSGAATTTANARAPGATGLSGAGLITGAGAGTSARPPTLP